MAFTGAVAGQVLRSSIGVILQSNVTLSEREVTLRTIRAVQMYTPGRYQEFQAIARQALLLTDAGTRVTFSGGVPIPRNGLPVDPSITTAGRSFRYRALIEVTGASGSEVRTVAVINSPVALTYQQMREMIEADITGFTSDRPSVRQAILALGTLNPPAITIISAGRSR